MTEAPLPPQAAFSMTVTVSSQPAFLPALEALTARVGEFVGCQAAAAKALGVAVARALTGAWRGLERGGSAGHVDLVFRGNGRVLRVDLTCTAPLPAGTTLEEALGGAEAVSGLRQFVDRVEFGDENGAPFCRLTQQIRDRH
jgi:hypothetical protein